MMCLCTLIENLQECSKLKQCEFPTEIQCYIVIYSSNKMPYSNENQWDAATQNINKSQKLILSKRIQTQKITHCKMWFIKFKNRSVCGGRNESSFSFGNEEKP